MNDIDGVPHILDVIVVSLNTRSREVDTMKDWDELWWAVKYIGSAVIVASTISGIFIYFMERGG